MVFRLSALFEFPCQADPKSTTTVYIFLQLSWRIGPSPSPFYAYVLRLCGCIKRLVGIQDVGFSWRDTGGQTLPQTSGSVRSGLRNPRLSAASCSHDA